MAKVWRARRLLQVTAILGTLLISLPICLSYVYGNMSTYIISYFKFHLGPEAFDVQPEWLLPSYGVSMACGCFSTQWLTKAFRNNIHLLEAVLVIFFDLGVFLTYFTVRHSVGFMLISFIVCCGFTGGATNMLGLIYASKILSERVGLASAVVTSGAGIGTAVLNYITLLYVNPDNLTPDVGENSMAYFSQTTVVNKVPRAFLALGFSSLSFHVIGLLFQQLPIHCSNKMQIIFTGPKFTDEKTALKNSDQTTSRTNHQQSTVLLRDNNCENITKHTEVDSSVKEPPQNRESQDLMPSQVLQTESFYLLFLSLVVMTYGNFLVLNYYKIYGQLWIKDDTFLTSVGSFSALGVCLYRILAGICLDKFGVKNTMISTIATCAIVANVWFFAARWNRWLYFACCQILTALYSSIYSIFPIAALKFYGETWYAFNYGLILFAHVLTNLILPFVCPLLLERYGWFSLAFVASAASTFALVCLVVKMRDVIKIY